MLETGKYYRCTNTVTKPTGEILFKEGNKYLAISQFELRNALGGQTLILTGNVIFTDNFEPKPISEEEPENEPGHTQETDQELLDSFAKIAFGKLLERCSYDQLIGEKDKEGLTDTAYRFAASMLKSRGKLG